MGLRVSRFGLLNILVWSFVVGANAAPTLRLVSSTVGPASIAVGSNGPTQLVEAYNAGDGTLTLSQITSSAPWVSATVGSPGPCTTIFTVSTCIPINVALNTSSLSAGMQTGILTVTAPAGVVDAPQTITVTVNMGGGVPSSINVYVPPSGTVTVPAPTNSALRWQATTKDGNNWLSMSISSSGSFKFVYPWYVQVQPTAANTPGTYTGTVSLSGSSFAADNKNIAVTMNVTTQPIAQAPSPLNITLAAGAPPQTQVSAIPMTLTNSGMGTLTVTGAVAATSSCGNSWLTATQISTGAVLSVDPTGMSAGTTCNGTITFTTNAVNTIAPVPVTMQVVAKGPPTINYQGVLNNANFAPGDAVDAGDILVVKGSQFSFANPTTGGYTAGQAPPLATDIGGAQVLVNGTPAPMFYSLYGQLAFQLPVNTPQGLAVIQVKRDDGSVSNLASVQVNALAPRLLLIGVGNYGAIQNATDGSYPLAAGAFPGLNTHPANPGDTLVIYAIGLGPTSPTVTEGQPAPGAPYANLPSGITVAFESPTSDLVAPAVATPFFAGLSPGYAGLYQVNVTIPQNTPAGLVNLFLTYPGNILSNIVQIAVQ